MNDITIADGLSDSNAAPQSLGAAILFEVAELTLELNDCVVRDNASTGANFANAVIFFTMPGNSLYINRCSFENNSAIATNGPANGGVFFSGASDTTIQVYDSSFISNMAHSEGNFAFGGVVGAGTNGLDYSFTNCTFDSNRAVSTQTAIGGVLGDGTSENNLQFTNCTFLNNKAECIGDSCASVFGGAIGSGASSDISIDFCTFANNEVLCSSGSCNSLEGDALASLGQIGFNNISISNSIIYGEEPSENCSGNIGSLGYNLENGSSCFDGTVVGDKPNTDPGLEPAGLQDNGGPTETIAILGFSPAVDKASPACPPPDTDQRGVVRPQMTRCDIGAYELEIMARPIPTLSEWGLIAMAGVLGIVGLLFLRRRKIAA